MRVRYRVFKSSFKSWDTLFQEAATFASSKGNGRVINISHACDHQTATVTVWYWSK